jgi:cell division transport system permease protein
MVMIFKSLFYHFKESWKNLFRNAWMTFASVSSVAMTLLILGGFIVMTMNLNYITQGVENKVEIRVHIDRTAEKDEVTAMRSKLEHVKNVKSVEFSSKDDELELMRESWGKNSSVLDMFEQNNPLHDVYVVKLVNPQDVEKAAKDIESIDFVDKLQYGKGFVNNLFNVTRIGRYVGIGLIVGLIFTTIFLISNTIKITIIARRREIEIMRLVGATNAFIRWPFFLEGIWLGTLGAAIPIGILSLAYYYLYTNVVERLNVQFLQLLPPNPFLYQLAGILIGIGSIIGVLASLMSIRKFLKV